MLFDLKSGKRRRVIQVIFGFLAFVFFISFVGFGIGSDVSGGIFDAIGLGNDGSGDTQYEEQIEDAEQAIEADPKDEQAHADLVQYRFLSAQEAGITQTAQGPEISEEANALLEDTAAAWEAYLALDPKEPDLTPATSAQQAFFLLNDADGAAGAQRVVAQIQDTSTSYQQLAYYLYVDGQIKAGDEAADKAAELADASERKQVEKQMASLREQAVKLQKQLEKAAEKGGNNPDAGADFQNPFGELGAAGAGAGVTTPTP